MLASPANAILARRRVDALPQALRPRSLVQHANNLACCAILPHRLSYGAPEKLALGHVREAHDRIRHALAQLPEKRPAESRSLCPEIWAACHWFRLTVP